MSEMPKAYDFASTEERLYQWWEENGWFKPEARPDDAEPYVISIPPPNVTGELHMGHVMFVGLEDLMIRRLGNFSVLIGLICLVIFFTSSSFIFEEYYLFLFSSWSSCLVRLSPSGANGNHLKTTQSWNSYHRKALGLVTSNRDEPISNMINFWQY